MTTRALKRDLAALEKDMSPVTLASEARMLQGHLTPVAGMSRSGIAGRAASTSPRRNVNDSLRLLVLQKTSI